VGQSGHVSFRGFAAAHCGKPYGLPFKVVVFRGQLGKPWQAAEKPFGLGKRRQNDRRNHTNMGHIEDLLRACFV
jgi:hypothetical protein